MSGANSSTAAVRPAQSMKSTFQTPKWEDAKMSKLRIVSIVLAVLSAGWISMADAASLAVNFPSTSGWTVAGTAGAPGYAQAHWVNTNNWQSSWGNTYPLVTGSGQATTAVMDWYASDVTNWKFGDATNDNQKMMDCGIASPNVGLVQAHVVNVPYAAYDVVVYFSPQLEHATVAKYTIGATSVYAQVGAMGYFANNDTFTQVPLTSTADLQNLTPIGNYIVFKNVTGSTLQITAQPGWAGKSIFNEVQGTPYASISGFQIVEVPEPATVAVLALGGCLLVTLRKRN